jgi:hypothetical protein
MGDESGGAGIDVAEPIAPGKSKRHINPGVAPEIVPALLMVPPPE